MVERRVLLVVDGDASRRAELRRLLAPTPHALVVATDTDDGAARFDEAKPDLVFLAEPTTGTHGGALLEKLAARADAMAALIFSTDQKAEMPPPREGTLPPGLAAVLPLPLTRAAIDHALVELAARRAAVFAQSAMELDLDALPPPALEEPAPPEPPPPAVEAARPPPAAEPPTVQEAAPAPTKEAPPLDEPVPAGPPVLDEPTQLGTSDDTMAVAESLSDLAGAPDEKAPDEEVEGERTPPEGTPASVVADALQEPPPSSDPPSEPTAEVSVPVATDAPSEPTAEVTGRTNVGDEPAGLEEVRAATAPAEPAPSSSEEDVFASAPAPSSAEPPPPPPPVLSRAKSEPRDEEPAPAPVPDEPASSRSDERGAPVPTGERTPQAPGVPMPRVVKLDSPPVPRELELSSSERAQTQKGGFRVLDEAILGPDLTQRLLLLYRLLDGGTLYQVLGVEKDADAAQVTQAFHRISLEFHPDRSVLMGSGPLKECMRAVYARATEAYRVLGDPAQRAAYDRALESMRQAPPSTDTGPFRASPTTNPQLPSVIVENVDDEVTIRPALPAGATPATRGGAAPAAGRAPQRNKSPTTPSMAVPPTTPPPTPTPPPPPPAPAAPSVEPLVEDSATTVGGKKFLRLAAQALGKNDLNGARLNLTFALGYEPDNAVLKKRLAEIEGKMARPAAR